MKEQKMIAEKILTGGMIELFKINGLYYVKAVVNGVVKFSECVSRSAAEYFIFDAKYCGNLDF